jgi:hypothetical protein
MLMKYFKRTRKTVKKSFLWDMFALQHGFIKSLFSTSDLNNSQQVTMPLSEKENINFEQCAEVMLKYAIFFMVTGLLLAVYALYLAFDNAISASLLCIIITITMWAMAFRYHFWSTQAKLKKYSMRFREYVVYLKSLSTQA